MLRKVNYLSSALFVIANLLSLSTDVTAQTIYRVNINSLCTSGCDGSTWAKAYPNLGDALAVSTSTDELWVAQGDYKPTDSLGVVPAIPKNGFFHVKDGVSVFGGFDATETMRSERNWEVNETILNGDLDGNDLANYPDLPDTFLLNPERQDNCLHVVRTFRSSASTIIDGLSIINGNSYAGAHDTLNIFPIGFGGGVLEDSDNFTGSKPTIKNCEFRYNSAYHRGGAIFIGNVFGECSPQIFDCTFVKNFSRQPGGAFAHDNFGGKANEGLFENCTFQENKTLENGGAIYLTVNQTFRIQNCKFDGNIANINGGGISFGNLNIYIFIPGHYVKIENSQFFGNTANNAGGALFATTESSKQLNDTLIGVEIDDNHALIGGGMYIQVNNSYASSNIYMENTQFTNNNVASDGGALYIFTQSLSSNQTHFVNSTFSNNNATSEGGAIYTHTEGVDVGKYENCTFQNNTSSFGGAILNETIFASSICRSQFINSNFNNNLSTSDGGAIYNYAVNGSTMAQSYNHTHFIDNNASRHGGAYYGWCATGSAIADTFANGTFVADTSASLGGAIYSYTADANSSTELTIDQTTFEDNRAYSLGGAIYQNTNNSSSNTSRISNTTFHNNYGFDAGGIYTKTLGVNSLSALEINQTTFDNNETPNGGGAMYVYTHGGGTNNSVFNNNQFTNNRAVNGGVLVLNTRDTLSLSNLQITDCAMTSNTSSLDGGALYILTTHRAQNNSVFSNNDIQKNRAGDEGGAIYCKVDGGVDSVLYDGCVFLLDSAYRGGAMLLESFVPHGILATNFKDCKFGQNNAVFGGAMYTYPASASALYPRFINSTFYLNRATSASVHYSDLQGGNSKVEFINSTASRNYAPFRGSLYTRFIAGTTDDRVYNSIFWGNSGSEIETEGPKIKVGHSLVQGFDQDSIIDLGGNLSLDPIFVDAAQNNFVLKRCSPAVNVGLNAYVPPGIAEDVNNNPRISESIVDMGAHEILSSVSANFYVDKTATTGGDGKSWPQAFHSIRDAVGSACTGDTVFIAEGIYYIAEPGNLDAPILLSLPITLLGGYSAGGAVRDHALYQSILSGDIDQDDENVFAENIFEIKGNNARTVLNVQATCWVDGLTVTGGMANGDGGYPNPNRRGGGIFNNSNSTYKNINIAGNFATGNVGNGFGGGVYSLLHPNWINCSFGYNTAVPSGGAIYANSNSSFVNCQFYENEANFGSAFYLAGGAIDFRNVTVTENGFPGASILRLAGGQMDIYNSIVANNHGTLYNGLLPTYHYSLVEGSGSSVAWDTLYGVDGGGNVDLFPGFKNPEIHDFRLADCSEAKNIGFNAFIPAGITEDLAGNTRINFTTVDLGAYESQNNSVVTNDNLYVDASSAGGSGDSWLDAKSGIQGINQELETSVANCEIIDSLFIAEGVYYPTNKLDETEAIFIDHPLYIGGGYKSGGTAYDPLKYGTIISGDIDRNDPFIFLNSHNEIVGNNSQTVIRTVAEAHLDGLVITGGNADGAGAFPSPTKRGGGLYNDADCKITNTRFVSNYCRPSNGGWGGALYALSGKLYVENCNFENNSVGGSGGTMYIYSDSADYINCTFENNISPNSASVGWMNNGVYRFINNTFVSNSGINGTLRLSGVNPLRFYNNIFWDNASGTSLITGDSAVAYHSIVQGSGGSGSWNIPNLGDGGGNLDADPQLGKYLTPKNCSPAINAGLNSYVPSGLTKDIFNRQRMISAVDMGAVESQITVADDETYFVDQSASGSQDGSSWSNAINEMTVLFENTCLEDGDSIFVAQGNYSPAADFHEYDRRSSFIPSENLKLIGGYSPGGSQRNPLQYETSLNGDLQGDGVRENNTSNVVQLISNDSSFILDGFVIENGYADGNTLLTRTGAGIFSNGSNATIKNSVFRNNEAHSQTTVGVGGGMIVFGGQPKLINNLWYDNFATNDGGALSTQSGSIDVVNNTFANNVSLLNGGAIQTYQGIVDVKNSFFFNNQGGLKHLYNPVLGGSIDISHCMFDDTLESNITDLGGSIYSTFPNFIDTAIHDYRLKPCSPGVDVGLNITNSCLEDIQGKARIVNTVDLGASESANGLFTGGNKVLVDVSKSGSGSSWSDAVPSLADAIDICDLCDVDTILIAEGVYFPDIGQDQTEGDRAARFKINKPLFIRGSYPSGGGNTDLLNHATILSGEIGNSTSFEDNTKTIMDLNAYAHLDQLIFEKGNAGIIGSPGGAGRDGGGIFTDKGGYFTNLIFRNNAAVIGGALYARDLPILMENCLFHDNHSYAYGGAIGLDFINSSDTSIFKNVTMAQNTSDPAAFGIDGGAIALFAANARLENGIVYYHDNPYRLLSGGTLTMNYTNAQGGYTGVGNLDIDPMFLDTMTNNFTLRYGSPILDAGSNDLVSYNTDIFGNARIINNTVDLGAFEFNFEFPCGQYSMLAVDDNPVYKGMYKASGQVSSAGIVKSSSNGKVTFKSESNILLNPNFEVKLGEEFEALIEDPCVD